jgi:argininosuccinate synthase
MEKGGEGFSAHDRIGQLALRNLDIADTRQKIQIYRDAGILQPNASLTDLLE